MIGDLIDSGAQRVLGRFYDPEFVSLSILLSGGALLSIYGILSGIDGSVWLLGMVGVVEILLIGSLYRRETRWRSEDPDRAVTVTRDSRGMISMTTILLLAVIGLAIWIIGPDQAVSIVVDQLEQLLGGL